jgi:hypothetical protein
MSTAAAGSIGPNGGTAVGNQNNPGSRYGRDSFVRPHRLVVNYTYQFPKMKGGNAFAQQAVNGWSIQGVTTFQTGHYLTVTYTNTNNVYGINGTDGDRPNLSGACTSKSQFVTSGSLTSKLNDYINANCFTAPAVVGDDGVATGFGDAGIGLLQGPKELNFDFSLIKHFPVHKIKETGDLEFRSEFFNIFNHPLFQDPADLNYGDGSFGQITTNYGNPRIIQFALKLSF